MADKKATDADAIVSRVRDRLADDPKGGYKSFANFAHDVWKAGPGGKRPPPRLAAWQKTTMVEYDDEQGGYLVPTEFSQRLLKTSIEQGHVRPRASFVPMGTNRIAVPAIHDATHAGGVYYGGMTLYKPGENEGKSRSKPALAQVGLTLHKITAFVWVTEELVADSPQSLDTLLTGIFSDCIGHYEDDRFINGTGVNQPLGAATAGNPSLIAEPRMVAGRIRGADIMRMAQRLYPGCWANAIWMISQSALFDVVGASFEPAGGAVTDRTPLFVSSGTIGNGGVGTILGRPCIVSEKCRALGTAGDIFLVDWSQYLVGGKTAGGAPVVEWSMHLYFDYDEHDFRAVLRSDGQPWWQQTVTPTYGPETLSPFVVLDTTATTTQAPTTTVATTTAQA